MSPLQLALLLRAYCMPRPNCGIRPEEAYAPAMVDAIEDFRARGIFDPAADTGRLRYGFDDGRPVITDKGHSLARRILDAAAEFNKEAA